MCADGNDGGGAWAKTKVLSHTVRAVLSTTLTRFSLSLSFSLSIFRPFFFLFSISALLPLTSNNNGKIEKKYIKNIEKVKKNKNPYFAFLFDVKVVFMRCTHHFDAFFLDF